MRLFINSLSGAEDVITPSEPLYDQEIWGANTPLSSYTNYRIGGMCISNNNVIIHCPSAFFGLSNDGNPSEIPMTRSLDNGETWQDSRLIAPRDLGTVPERRTYSPYLVCDRSNNRVWCLFDLINEAGNYSEQPQPVPSWDFTLFLMYSDDEGLTWSTPNDVTSIFTNSILNAPNAYQLTAGGQTGLCLADGTLVLSAYAGLQLSNPTAYSISQVVFFTSVDNGVTWIAHGANTPVYSNEVAMIEQPLGTIMVNARQGTNGRRVWTTTNLGDSGIAHASDTYLYSVNCHAGLTTAITTGGNKVFLFSTPKTTTRERTTIRASIDLINWIDVYTLSLPSTQGYSNIEYYNGLLVAFYEADHESSTVNGAIRYVNLTNMIDTFYDSALAMDDTEIPEQLADLYKHTGTNTTQFLIWNTKDNTIITEFEIWVDGNLYDTVLGQKSLSKNIVGFTPNTNYNIYAIAKDAAGNSLQSNTINVTTDV